MKGSRKIGFDVPPRHCRVEGVNQWAGLGVTVLADCQLQIGAAQRADEQITRDVLVGDPVVQHRRADATLQLGFAVFKANKQNARALENIFAEQRPAGRQRQGADDSHGSLADRAVAQQ